MADRVTRVIVAPDQPPAVPSVAQYATALVPPGATVQVKLVVNGVDVAMLGPWVASARVARNALAQVRLRVDDGADVDQLVPEVVAVPTR